MPRLDSAGGGGGGVVTAINNATANELVTIGATTTELDAETSMVISGGKMGVGTTAPLLALDVVNGYRVKGAATSVLTGSIDPIASTTVTGVGTAFTTELIPGDNITVSSQTKSVQAIASNTSLTVDTAFSDNANDTSPDKLAAILALIDSSDATKLVVKHDGAVGINTASPTQKLEVSGNIRTSGWFYADGTTSGMKRGGHANHLLVQGNTGISFATNGEVRRMSMSSTGLRIRSQDLPTIPLHVIGDSGTSVEVAKFDNGGGGTDGCYISIGGSAALGGGYIKYDKAIDRIGIGHHGANMSLELKGYDGTNPSKYLFNGNTGNFAIVNGDASFTPNAAAVANLFIKNGTAPDAGTTDTCSFYAAAGVMRVVNAAGADTIISPHNEEGEWEFNSRNVNTGKTVRINMERMIKKLEEFTGETFIEYE